VAIDFRIDLDAGLLIVEVEGRVVPDDVVRYRTRLLADSDFSPGMNTLVDCREASTDGFNASDLQFLANDIASRRRLLGRAKCAVLVSTDAAYGLLRMYEAYTLESPVEVRVFRDEDEALAWVTALGAA
jgi:hypothetical protein